MNNGFCIADTREKIRAHISSVASLRGRHHIRQSATPSWANKVAGWTRNVSAKKEAVRIVTPDHFSIAGNFFYDDSNRNVPQPCVVLVHHFRRDKEQWGQFPEDLVADGFKVLAYDIRGHGKSDNVRDVTSLLSDPQQAPFDFDGALEWLEKRNDVNADRIGVIGTSIGAHIACEASAIYGDRVKAAVAVSPSLRGTLDFLEHKPGVHVMRSVLYVAAEGDGTHARDALDLSAKHTEEPKGVRIFNGLSDHGIDLINKMPEVKRFAVMWLKEHLK